MRRRHGGQDAQHYLARRFLCGDCKRVVVKVVLHHRSPKCQMDSCPRLSLAPPPQLMSWISRGLSWGPAKDVPILQSRIQDLFERFQSGYGSASYASSSSPALQTPAPSHVGIQPGRTASYSTFPRHDARRDVQIVLQITSNVSELVRGRRAELQSPGYSSK